MEHEVPGDPRNISKATILAWRKFSNCRLFVKSSQVKSIHKQQTTIRKPIECAPEASSGGREWAEMTEGFHLEATRHRVLTYVPSEEK